MPEVIFFKTQPIPQASINSTTFSQSTFYKQLEVLDESPPALTTPPPNPLPDDQDRWHLT